jgi:intein-encoded DNA endonuclease-like protein
MSLYSCFDWFKKLKLFVNERNLKIDVVLKASRAVVIRWFSLNEAPLGLIKFISNYLPYFEKLNIFFNIITKKVWLVCTNYWEFWIWEVRSDQTRSVASWTERISNTAHNTTYWTHFVSKFKNPAGGCLWRYLWKVLRWYKNG